MKAKRLIEELQKFDPEAEVRLNDSHGSEVLFVVALDKRYLQPCNKDLENVVWLESKDDIDLGEEIETQFQHAVEVQMDELDFFINLLEIGINIKDIQMFAPDRYEYSYNFMSEHGLI